jgi:hypothetical protein
VPGEPVDQFGLLLAEPDHVDAVGLFLDGVQAEPLEEVGAGAAGEEHGGVAVGDGRDAGVDAVGDGELGVGVEVEVGVGDVARVGHGELVGLLEHEGVVAVVGADDGHAVDRGGPLAAQAQGGLGEEEGPALVAHLGAELGLLEGPLGAVEVERAGARAGPELAGGGDPGLGDLVEVEDHVVAQVAGDGREEVADEGGDIDAVVGVLGEVAQGVVGLAVAGGEDEGGAVGHQRPGVGDGVLVVLHHAGGHDDDLGALLVLGAEHLGGDPGHLGADIGPQDDDGVEVEVLDIVEGVGGVALGDIPVAGLVADQEDVGAGEGLLEGVLGAELEEGVADVGRPVPGEDTDAGRAGLGHLPVWVSFHRWAPGNVGPTGVVVPID